MRVVETTTFELTLRIPSVSPLGETRPRLATAIPKSKRNPRQTKKHGVGGEARADTEQQKRRNTPSRRVLERMLGCDGIRIRAYDYISHHHTLRACDIRFHYEFLLK